MKISNRVVRYHRWLRDIALPQERAKINAFSSLRNRTGPLPNGRVLAAWLPLIFVAREVLCATRMDGTRASQAASTFRAEPFRRKYNRARCLRRDNASAPAVPSGA